jgi:outer membrane protein TolC
VLPIGVLVLLPGLASAGYLQALPSEVEVRRALKGSPAIIAAREQMDIAAARQGQLEAGNYEWTLGATGQRRTDPQGLTYNEQSYELSRSLRLWGKAGLDRDLGSRIRSVGEDAFSDNWHEASRALLSGWFGWLRAQRTSAVLGAQAALLEQQLATVRARVRAGDAPRVEEMLAETEIDRHAAAVAAAGLQEQDVALRLKRQFPDLSLAPPGAIDEPRLPAGSDDDWVQRILADNHEIELAQGQQEQARIAARRAARDRMPDPTVGVRYSGNFDGNRRVVGLIFSVPLGGPARSAAYAAALGEASVAAQKARDIQLKVETDARHATLAMRSAYSQWERLRQAAARGDVSAKVLAKGYSLGEFSITELLTARRQALDADLAAATAQLDALEAIARLQLDAHEIWVRETTYTAAGDTNISTR